IAEYPNGINADRFTYQAGTGAFTLGGDVRLSTNNKTIKLRSCTLTQNGELRDRRSLFDDFKDALSIRTKLEMLPRITKIYDDAELPDEVRYLLALHTLRPHLTWHAPYLPPLPEGREKREVIKEVERIAGDSGTRWQETLGGEAWMLD